MSVLLSFLIIVDGGYLLRKYTAARAFSGLKAVNTPRVI